MMKVLNQMLKLPITALVYSMEMLAKTLQGLQKIADRGIDAALSGTVQAPGGGLDGSDRTNGATASGSPQIPGSPLGGRSDPRGDKPTSVTDGTVEEGAAKNFQEENNMPDTHLSDDMLKLVRYKILFVKRDYEVAFPEAEELVADNLTDTGYTAWKIAEFIQDLDHTAVPTGKWGGGKDENTKPKYPKYAQHKDGRWVIEKLDEDDKKYLRVFFEVLDRYPREKFRHEERQIEVLEEIRDKL
jgi:hypothetical protein